MSSTPLIFVYSRCFLTEDSSLIASLDSSFTVSSGQCFTFCYHDNHNILPVFHPSNSLSLYLKSSAQSLFFCTLTFTFLPDNSIIHCFHILDFAPAFNYFPCLWIIINHIIFVWPSGINIFWLN